MKTIILLISVFLLNGCAHSQRLDNAGARERIIGLEESKKTTRSNFQHVSDSTKFVFFMKSWRF